MSVHSFVRRLPAFIFFWGILVALTIVSSASAQTSVSIWPPTSTPAVAADPDTAAVQVGVKFRADYAGYITGIRFYKAAANTGTHVANLWSAAGARLATATFTNETSSGWQQVPFATPVAIAANTMYVASYHAPVGRYSVTEGYFSAGGVDTPPLHALADGVSGVNGVYAYGSSSTFPNQGWNATNYWVDVLFSGTAPPGDTAAPTVTAFSIPATSTSLTVPVTQFTASDNVGVTGFLITETATTPGTNAGWSATAPTSYAFASAGAKTVYAWARDAAGNVSSSQTASVTINLPVSDTTRPVVTAFSIPSTGSSLTVTITSFTATDNFAVTGYLLTTSATTPALTAPWLAAPPASYTFTSAGTKTLYAWARDAAGNISTSRSASVVITLSTNDTTRPTVTSFTLPGSASSLTVPITSFAATDNVAVAGYLVKTSSTNPTASAAGWSQTAQTSFTFPSAGSKTLYAWAKDAAGNVSARKSASVRITLPVGVPEPAGWFAGDMHVHRSCGGSPEAVSSLYSKMTPKNLAAISLLADMGNAEVQNATTDLPKVSGLDDPVSTAGRIVHWDAEWHWDPTYSQYPHQVLGGHIVALGLSSAYQRWDEYTFPILEWAHQQNAIAGFVHMQYLDGGIPQSLNCCIPIEYPVEVALGAADFISEDVDGSDTAIDAYYKLLNTGFRPALTAGTDYPCNGGQDLGTLLTYAQVPSGVMTYADWIDAIKHGRTVVSRNGHSEFLNLVANSAVGPGGEITFTGEGVVRAVVTWTASQSYSGTIELVHNGIVVSSRQANVTAGTSATLTADVQVTKSGWIAARRMGPDGHEVHTGALFVTVDDKPVRASRADAEFYVQWMDNLIARTSPGGAWNQFFSTSLNDAQTRYRNARALFSQIAAEAGEIEPPPPPPPPPRSAETIFTTQIPSTFDDDGSYELGTKFWSEVSGQITDVRLYAHASEGGIHTVRIWRVSDQTLLAGPFSWSITSGTAGWKNFTLPAPLTIAANTDYIVSISNSSDRYYAESANGFGTPIVNGHLHTYTASGVYSESMGSMPASVWQNANYYRDVVFVPQ